MKIAVVSDSTSDIPAELAEQFRIHIVRNMMLIDGRSVEDGKGITREEFYRMLPQMKELPTTGTASSGVYQELYEGIFDQGADYILSIHASSLLSGIVNAANAAAGGFDGRVHVFDSRSISLGLGFQAIAAAKAAQAGATFQEVLALLEGVRQRARVVAMLDTLEYARRSGRVSWAKANLGNFLSIKPFIGIQTDGLVHTVGEVRTRSRGIERLRTMLAGLGPLDWLALVHTNAEDEACRLADGLSIETKNPPLVVNITTVVGTHAGPKALGFAAIVSERPA